MKKLRCYLFFGLLLINIQAIYADNSQPAKIMATHQASNRHDEGLVKMSSESQQSAGIKTEILQVKSLPIYISAPGEAIPNMDLTTIITPRIPAQVVQRLAKVGDYVEQGQPLVQLSSVAMAKAQSELMMAYKEWLRAKQIKQQVIADKFYHIADMTYQQKYSSLLSFGMTRTQINDFLKSNDPNKADGIFTLLALRKGTIFSSDFVEGQMIEPGKIMYKIVDESNLWVDAKVPNGDSVNIRKDAQVIIQTPHHEFPAKVLQIHHKLEETTRTRVIRLSVPNPKDLLHPGEFVTCLIKTGETAPVLAVRKTVLVRTSEGNNAVYVEIKPNYFKENEVRVIKTIGSWRIIEGVKAGMRIVTKGVFFVHSESLKSNFNTHNH